MTDKELEEFIHHGETAFLAFAMMFGEGWAQRAIDIAKELRARLAQPEPEQKPQAWMLIKEQGVWGAAFRFRYDAEVAARELGERFSIVPIYTAPPQREWQSLTDEEINKAWDSTNKQRWVNGFARAIEAKLKEKNT